MSRLFETDCFPVEGAEYAGLGGERFNICRSHMDIP